MKATQEVTAEEEAVPQTTSTTDKTLMCKFFLKQRCRRPDCNFAHSEAEQQEACKRMVCRFDSRGTCRQGNRCWYRHISSEVGAPESTGSALGSEVSESDKLTSDWEREDGNDHLAKNRLDTSSDLTGSETRGHLDKMTLCKFWLRNTCQRADCRFAHGEAEQRAAYGKQRCRFDMAGGCRLGSECWYLHAAEPKKTEQPIRKEIVATSAADPVNWADLTDSDVSDDELLHATGQEQSKIKDSAAASPMQSYVSTSTASSVCGDTQRVDRWADLSSDSEDEFVPLRERETRRFTMPKSFGGFPSVMKA